ncbi:MAG: hypothetical protein A2751_00125 [Candidatus Doudnabacteria bacterium RIFCSPHIGHO2_01_FULL_46_14]|uniref:PilN domain-containing protein n=1 Tax=Candidatus Doudnabacteria bacterium RIFCSPHIGHO2_01_FULL_46_14 TaxID=1817824 RepID=A0A1F5NML2_9BACT|nr:MAG: hypothetical protein A2751_00125 [Candidatus Doudnabacteria bacterium RIFCSPHIGHO2_01_FULL_46_14]
MRGDINLLKNELSQRAPLGFSGPKSLLPLYLVIGLLVVEGLAFGTLLYYKKSIDRLVNAAELESSQLDLQMRQTETQLKDAISYQGRLNNFKNLLNSHIFWSPLFKELGDFTYKPVSFDTFQADIQKNRIVVTGSAPTYRDIAKVILGLKKSEKFTDIIFQSGGVSKGEETGFGFSLDIGFDPKLLRK